MPEDDTTEPPAPLHPAWTGRHHTPISDPNGTAVPGKSSDFFISHLLREVTTSVLRGREQWADLINEARVWPQNDLDTAGNLNPQAETNTIF